MLALLALSQIAEGQTGSPDDLYQQARQRAFAGERREAKELCEKALEMSPNHVDARLLLGRLHAWDGEYDAARRELGQVLKAKPDYVDAREALIDVELWSDNPREALRLAEEGLALDANNQTLNYKKARALRALGDLKGAAGAVDNALKTEPKFSEARIFGQQLKEEKEKYRAKIEYSADLFDQTFDPWHLVTFSLSRRMSWGSLVGRVNYAARFGREATQFEVDAYPRIRKGTYAYLNAGYSSSTIFPQKRFGSEIYQSLPRSFEASFGLRHLRFSGEGVTIYTGSVGKYYGNYWFSFRPYLTPSSIGRSFSGNFTIRRYLDDGESYLSLVAGAGSAPDERFSTFELIRLNSQKIGFEGRKQIGRDWGIVASFGFENQELKFGGTRKRYTFNFGIEKKF